MKDKPLSAFQHVFVSNVLEGKGCKDLLAKMVPVGTLSKEEVIQVYSQDYYARLTEALGESYEACWAVLGDESFFALIRELLKEYPSKDADLGKAGFDFPVFLKTHPVGEDYPFLHDLAEFEKGFWRMFHMEKSEGVQLQPEEMEAMISKPLNFSLRMEHYSWEYKINNIWQQRKLGFDGMELSHFQGRQNIILCRTIDKVNALEIKDGQSELLGHLISGLKLEEALDKVEIQGEEIQSLFYLLKEFNLIQP